MLNPQLKLNQDLFKSDISVIKQAPIREGFGQGLLKSAELDSRIVGLCADLTESTKMNLFKDKFPNRFIEIGVAEQNLASVASGMAAMGKIPAITSYAMFSPGRNWEQIRTTICYNDQKVVIAGSHAGVSVGPDGGTHQAIEDLAITRVIPNMTVFSPCDVIEAEKITMLALSDEIKTPSYIRLAREKTPVITTPETPFDYTKAELYFIPSAEIAEKRAKEAASSNNTKGTHSVDVGIIATGGLLYNALRAAHELEREGFAVKVLNLHTIKPIDTQSIVELATQSGALVTVEEHQVMGGVGSAVAEVVVSQMSSPVPIEFIGVQNQFGQSGTPAELIEHYGMGISHIISAAKKIIKRKSA